MANTTIFKTDYETKLQERLDYPQSWKEICDVRYTNGRVLEYNYMSTVPASQAHTRGSAMTPTDWAVTQQYVTINQSRAHATYIDFADIAQQKWVTQMSLADLSGTILSEYVETDMLVNHAMWTDFDNASIGGAAGNIIVDSTTIPKIIRGLKREIREANGMKLAKRLGMFALWRAVDFEVLEAKPLHIGLVKLFLIKAKVQRWITHTKQALAVQVKRLSEREPKQFGYATV